MKFATTELGLVACLLALLPAPALAIDTENVLGRLSLEDLMQVEVTSVS